MSRVVPSLVKLLTQACCVRRFRSVSCADVCRLKEALINAAMGSFAAKANVFLVKAASHSGGRERMA